MRGAHAHDGACDRVRGADRDSEARREQDCKRAAGLGTEATDWPQPRDPRAHRMHDAPAAEGGAERDHDIGADLDPEWYVARRLQIEMMEHSGLRSKELARRNEQAGDD